MNRVRTLCRRALLGVQAQSVGHVDAANDQDVTVLLDLARGFRREEPLAGWDQARFQRTAKGPGQSTRGRGDEVVERRVVRFVHVLVNAIVLSDG